MPLGGYESLDAAIESPLSEVFRRVQIKRRQKSNGKFEANWQDITSYIKKFGVLKSAIDDIKLNRFTHEGISLVADNDTGKFNQTSNQNSLWNGYLPQYRTLLRIQAGYLTPEGLELPPTDTTIGIYILDKQISIKSNSNDVTLRCASLKSLFDEVQAAAIPGMDATLTASDIFAKIRDHTDGSGNFIFREFITSTSWTIATTTTNYNPNTTTSLADLSTWDLMEKLAESEGYVVLINKTGGIEFRSRAARQADVQWTFRGQDFARPTIQYIGDYKEALDKYYNRFRLKYLEPDTSTSYVETGTSVAVNDTNTAWVYGQRKYEFENLLIPTTATAQAIVSNLLSTVGTVTSEVTMKTEFVPHVELLDRIAASFHSYDLAGSTRWDQFDWAPDTGDTGTAWSAEGENFDWDDKQFVVISRELDLDDFSMEYKGREL